MFKTVAMANKGYGAIDVAIIIVGIFKPLAAAFERSLVAHVAARA